MPGENPLWFGRFCAYLNQGSGRSVLRTYNAEREKAGKAGKKQVPGAWDRASLSFVWEHHAYGYDTHLRAEEQAFVEEQRQRERAAVARERRDQRERELRAAKDLYDRGFALLALPIERDKELDHGMIIRVPDYRAHRTAADLFAQGKEQARAALDMPKRTVVDVRNLNEDELVYLYEQLLEEGQGQEETPGDKTKSVH